jgi:hypothetical protein
VSQALQVMYSTNQLVPKIKQIAKTRIHNLAYNVKGSDISRLL